ncbi:hydrogenase-related [Anaeramoeba flamelloides]|uniref:Hydrogenase-related n=1 Tax=Anaeramoeba flamelloides TaxID=1746091 RepID=A0AAV7Z0J1_9EUKA|nr:hydrogenase-related [Anaeramoeba flamelloides]
MSDWSKRFLERKHIGNTALQYQRMIQVEVAKLFFKGNFVEQINSVPRKFAPHREDSIRCCTFKEHEILKNRVMSSLGFIMNDTVDNWTTLSEYAKKALDRKEIEEPIFGIMDIACEHCVKKNFLVTDACAGCLGKPCLNGCPVGAITITKNAKAKINEHECISCGKCVIACPWNAIIKVSIPCEESCPVKAIHRNKQGKQVIDYSKCVYCGNCINACMFLAPVQKSQIIDVLKNFHNKEKKIVALIAPSLYSQFPKANLNQIVESLKKLGFDKVVEVAIGAEETTKHEAQEFLEVKDFMTTSCCWSFFEMIHKHIPCLKDKISKTPTPMHITGELVREKIPNSINVFISPCMSKRQESLYDDYIDYVLTFEELAALLVARDIDPNKMPKKGVPDLLFGEAHQEGRGFPITGGVVGAISSLIGDKKEIRLVKFEGLSRSVRNELYQFCEGKRDENLIEIMACRGGCIAGPNVINKKISKSKRDIKKLKQNSKSIQNINEKDEN